MNIFKYIIVGSILSLTVGHFAWAQTTGNLEVTQKVRNLTKQDLAWLDSLQANPGDRIEFQITLI